MQKKIIVCLITLLFLAPVSGLAKEEKESFGHQVGQFGRDISDGIKDGYNETKKAGKEAYEGSKKAGKEASHEVKKDSKSAWSKTKQGFKNFWKDVKDGFGGDKHESKSQ